MRHLLDLWPVIWDEWVFFRRNFLKITASALIAPLLYMVAFGIGIGGSTGFKGITYMKFLVPGIVALTTMNGSYKAISVKMITNRVYDKTFEQYLIAPISVFSFCLGKAVAGALRGMYTGMLVLTMAYVLGVRMNVNWIFYGLMFLNGLTFGTLGLLGALLAKSHADMNRFGTFVMLPMTFLCGTFFRTEHLPAGLRQLIQLLPLTHMTGMLRAIATYQGFYLTSVIVLVIYWLLFLLMAYRKCLRIAA